MQRKNKTPEQRTNLQRFCLDRRNEQDFDLCVLAVIIESVRFIKRGYPQIFQQVTCNSDKRKRFIERFDEALFWICSKPDSEE
jgi:hypothetical protein